MKLINELLPSFIATKHTQKRKKEKDLEFGQLSGNQWEQELNRIHPLHLHSDQELDLEREKEREKKRERERERKGGSVWRESKLCVNVILCLWSMNLRDQKNV